MLAEARVLVKLSGVHDPELNVPAVLGLEWDVGRKVKSAAESVVKVRRGEDLQGEKVESEIRGKVAAQGAWILMEFIEGRSLKELLREVDIWAKNLGDTGDEQKTRIEQDVRSLLRRIGRAVAAMHSKGGVVHGDLTSSNIMVRPWKYSKRKQVNGGHEGEEVDTDPADVPNLNGEIVLIDFGLATQSIQDEDRAVDLYVLERAFGSTHPKQEGWFDAEVLQHSDGYRGVYKGANVVLKRLEEVRLRGRKRSMIG